jgi:hypothetical protein
MAEKRNIRIEDDKANIYYPHSKAVTTFLDDKSNLFTATNVEDALKELFQFADSGRQEIASVIGSPAKNTDTFAQLKAHIQNAKNTLTTSLTSKGQASVNTEALVKLINKVDNISTGLQFVRGGTPSFNIPGDVYWYKETISVPMNLSFEPKLILVYWSLGWASSTLASGSASYSKDWTFYPSSNLNGHVPGGNAILSISEVSKEQFKLTMDIYTKNYTHKNMQSGIWLALG